MITKFDNFSLKPSNTNGILNSLLLSLLFTVSNFYIYILLIHTDLQDSIYQSLLIGNLSAAADLFFDNGKPVEALLLAITAGPKTLSRIQNKYLNVSNLVLIA